MASDSPNEWASGEESDAHDAHDARGLRVSGLDGAAPGAGPAARGWRWGLRLGGGVALLTLIAVAAVALSPLLPRPAPPRPAKLAPVNVLALQVPASARKCLRAAAWSPDGARIAFVRDSACDPRATTDPNDPTALIFDAISGKLESAYPLARMILSAAAPPDAQVNISDVIWTPRGDQIAVLYTIFKPNGATEATASADGVALLTVRGIHAGRLRSSEEAPLPETNADPLTLTGPRTIAEWGMMEASASRRLLTVEPAYAYQWNPDGSLAPILLSSFPQPDRQDSVSLWRDGQMWLVNARVCSNGLETFLPQPYLALSLRRLAWSPDGAWLVGLSAGARYPLPDSSRTPTPRIAPADCAEGPAAEDVPLGPATDNGLRTAAKLPATGPNASISLAWRPDGKRLAAFVFSVGGEGSAILIYDCATGTLVRRYTAGQIPNTGQPGTGPAKNFWTFFTGGVWSPDGRRLLVETVGVGALPFILGPHALGE